MGYALFYRKKGNKRWFREGEIFYTRANAVKWYGKNISTKGYEYKLKKVSGTVTFFKRGK